MLNSFTVRELDRHSTVWISKSFDVTVREASKILFELFSAGVVKFSGSNEKRNYSQLLAMRSFSDRIPPVVEFYFDYVGVVCVRGWVLQCLPKYLSPSGCTDEEFRRILGVIEQWEFRQNFLSGIELGYDTEASGAVPLMLYIIRDYYDVGLYSSHEEVVEIGGAGEIQWDRTINDIVPVLSDGKPVYLDLYRRRLNVDDRDYFYLLHRYVVTCCSKFLQDAGLGFFFDVPALHLSDASIEEFGDTEYILNRLLREQGFQFETRKLDMLRALHAYISMDYSLDESSDVAVFGTSSFNLVWEFVCQRVFGDMLDVPIRELPLSGGLSDRFKEVSSLRGLIERPVWSGEDVDGLYEVASKGTLIPDMVSVVEVDDISTMTIFDAKYYVIHLSRDGGVQGQPGVADISKQFLYQLAFTEFCSDHEIDSIFNCFLLPSDSDESRVVGSVSMPMFERMEMKGVGIWLISASKLFKMSLHGGRFDLSDMTS